MRLVFLCAKRASPARFFISKQGILVMKKLQEIIGPLIDLGEIGVASAHPDDEVSHGHGITIARSLGANVHHLIYTKGKVSTKNYAQAQGISVERGDRVYEAHAGALALGMTTATILDYEDGGLQNQIQEAVEATITWGLEQNIHTFMTLGPIDDHADHNATRTIALHAATRLNAFGHVTSILEVRHKNEGDIHAAATDNSVAAIFRNLRAHSSQARLSDDPVANWNAVPGGLYMHPDDMAEFAQYPLLVDASYIHYSADKLTLPGIGKLILR